MFMCSGTSTSPAMRLFLLFAASSWRAAHHCKPLVCSSTAIFMSSCEPGPTRHAPSAPQVLLQEHVTAKQLPPDVFMRINKFHRITEELKTEYPSILPWKPLKGGARKKKMTNIKPGRAMTTSVSLQLRAIQFPSKYLLTSLHHQHRQ